RRHRGGRDLRGGPSSAGAANAPAGGRPRVDRRSRQGIDRGQRAGRGSFRARRTMAGGVGKTDSRGGAGSGPERPRAHLAGRGEAMEVLAGGLSFLIVAAILFFLFISGVRIINEYENGVVFRLGRYVGLKRAGFRWIIPVVERMVVIDLRTVTRDVPAQDVITKDNVSVKVSAVVYFRVVQADKAVLQVENYLYATSQLAQTTLRAILGQAELDQLLAERDRINRELQKVLDAHTDPWGIKVSNVEVKQIDLP